MSDMTAYIDRFFEQLELSEDIENGHCYKIFLRQSILAFLRKETKDTAMGVYRTFFDCYRVAMRGASNPFLDLLDMLRSYEENAAVLIDKQRDHYIHSVNVFLLGLCIYAQNSRYRAAFDKTVLADTAYSDAYKTRHEEFFFRWGLASLFHDVGYPVEITGRQINKFVDFASDADGGVRDKKRAKVKLSFSDFADLNSVSRVLWEEDFCSDYLEAYPDAADIDLYKPIDLLAHKLHTSLGVDTMETKRAFDDFVEVMGRGGFIDHGYYSAIIVLKWYGFLIQKAAFKPSLFFWPVLDSAGAILLHNAYRNILQKAPFNCPKMAPETYPVAWLLLLCDELQDWNREAYGILDRQMIAAADAGIGLEDESLCIRYVSHNRSLGEEFTEKKTALFAGLLDMDAVFSSVSLSAEVHQVSELPRQNVMPNPRPLLSEVEKLAKALHEINFVQRQKNDPAAVFVPFDKMPDEFKYSNLRRAMHVYDKLDKMHYRAVPKKQAEKPISEIPAEYVDALARMEHDSWMRERLDEGWELDTSLTAADRERKLSPYLVPWEELSEPIKDLDRAPVIGIPAALDAIGYAVVAQ